MGNIVADQELNQSSFNAIGLSDASLVGLSWGNDGKDLVLRLDHAKGYEVQLMCNWVRGISASISFPSDQCSPPFLWEASISPISNGFTVVLDFASQGHLRFDCQSLVHVGGA